MSEEESKHVVTERPQPRENGEGYIIVSNIGGIVEYQLSRGMPVHTVVSMLNMAAQDLMNKTLQMTQQHMIQFKKGQQENDSNRPKHDGQTRKKKRNTRTG